MRQEPIPLDQLLLDPNNYRLQEQEDFTSYSEDRFHLDRVQNATRKRLRSENLRPLRNSIVANGFLEIERIVVVPYKHEDEKYLVIEGNRRVAALLLIQDEYDAGIPIGNKLKSVMRGVPCLVADQEGQEAFFRQAIMGIRHVGGIREWGGYQRAKLIADLKDNHDLEANSISEMIGLGVREVNRRYRAFKALQQLENDENFGDNASAKLYPIFHEAVALPIVREWLGWNVETYAFENDEKREIFYELISPRIQDDGAENPPKVKSYSDVRALRVILANADAKADLLQMDRELVDALTIANTEQISRRWRREINDATTALKSIPALEVERLVDDEVKAIKSLIDVASRVLKSYERLRA